MLKSFSRCLRIWLLNVGFFCKLWERKRISEGTGIRGQCGLWYPCRRRLQDLGGGGTGGGEGRGGTRRSGGLVCLRLRKCWTWSAGTPAEASALSSPLPAPGEAVSWTVFHRIVACASIGREDWRERRPGIWPSGAHGLPCLRNVAEN